MFCLAILNNNNGGKEDKFLQHTFITQKNKDTYDKGNNDDEDDEHDHDASHQLENQEV